MTPSIHWVHHHAIRRDTDSNYSALLSVWDRLFGSRSPTSRTPEMPIGTEGLQGPRAPRAAGAALRTLAGLACGRARGPGGQCRHLSHGTGHIGARGLARAATTRGTGRTDEALREARLAEAAHFEAALELRDSKSLRLQLLKDDFCRWSMSSPEARELFDLALVPGEPPKLWIDLISSVVMEPDPRSYRFLQHRQDRREILFETADRELMAAAIRRHMAHRLVARERQAPVAAAPCDRRAIPPPP